MADLDDTVQGLIDARIAPLLARIEKLEAATKPAPTPVPPPVPPAGIPDGWVKEGGRLTYSRIVFTIKGGQILAGGKSTPDVAGTRNVVAMGVEDGVFMHVNTNGDVYRYTGRADWLWVRKIQLPPVNATVAGSVQATRS